MLQDFTPPAHIAIEFHWFAAEEGGLLGSQDVAAAYEKNGATVKGMLHMDSKFSLLLRFLSNLMTCLFQVVAFLKNGTTPIIGLFDTNVDKNITTFTTKLVEKYIPLPWKFTGCGSSCGSDHMSWTKAGFPVAFATEGLFEGSLLLIYFRLLCIFMNCADGPLTTIHTAFDDMDQHGQYSFEHMLEFVKLVSSMPYLLKYSSNHHTGNCIRC